MKRWSRSIDRVGDVMRLARDLTAAKRDTDIGSSANEV